MTRKNMADKTFCIKTLGCKLNQYESALIAQRFISRGWQAVDFGETADAVIINTCTVTDRSDKKCRNLIRQAARFSRTGAVIVTGCMVESSRKELERMGCILACFPNSAKDSIVHHAERLLEETSSANPSGDANNPLPFLRTRGYVKIQDGCDQHCSYCIVPTVRGSARSRPHHEVLAHVQALIEAECPEIVLTGITIGNYRDGDMDLARLVEKIVHCDGNFRLRITSIEPMHVSDALIEMLGHPKVCPHLHLPLQSGCDRILSLMNRPYRRVDYLSVVGKIRKKNPDIALGADIIVGFPGETESDFADTLAMVGDAGFSYVHQFTFSPRKNTPASLMTPVPNHIVRARSERLRMTAQTMSLSYRNKFLGRALPCVIEKKKRSAEFTAVSGNYIKIALPPDETAHSLRGTIAPVILEEVGIGINRGRIVRG